MLIIVIILSVSLAYSEVPMEVGLGRQDSTATPTSGVQMTPEAPKAATLPPQAPAQSTPQQADPMATFSNHLMATLNRFQDQFEQRMDRQNQKIAMLENKNTW